MTLASSCWVNRHIWPFPAGWEEHPATCSTPFPKGSQKLQAHSAFLSIRINTAEDVSRFDNRCWKTTAVSNNSRLKSSCFSVGFSLVLRLNTCKISEQWGLSFLCVVLLLRLVDLQPRGEQHVIQGEFTTGRSPPAPTHDLCGPTKASSEIISLLNIQETNEYKKSAWTEKTQWDPLQENSLKYQIFSLKLCRDTLAICLPCAVERRAPARGGCRVLDPCTGMVKPLWLVPGSWSGWMADERLHPILPWPFLFIASWRAAEPLPMWLAEGRAWGRQWCAKSPAGALGWNGWPDVVGICNVAKEIQSMLCTELCNKDLPLPPLVLIPILGRDHLPVCKTTQPVDLMSQAAWAKIKHS